jgi:hypothetical protein
MEPDFTVDSRVFPEIPQFKDCGTWISEALRHSGARIDMGMRLHATYRDAGFVNTATEVSHLSGCGFSREMAPSSRKPSAAFCRKSSNTESPRTKKSRLTPWPTAWTPPPATPIRKWVSSRYISAWARKL